MKYLLLTILITYSQLSLAYILKQGSVEVDIKDLEGFSLKIPEDKRKGFLSSTKRLEDTLYTILNMKHIKEYGLQNSIIDIEKAKYDAGERYLDEYSHTASLIVDYTTTDLYQFLVLEEIYKQVQNHVIETVNSKDYTQLAYEKYTINKEFYSNEETRTVAFINLPYTENNRQELIIQAKSILAEIKESKDNFDKVFDENKDKNNNIETVIVEDLKFDNNYELFSQFIFSPTEPGVIQKVIDFNNRFIFAKVNKINKKTFKPFEEVKDSILSSIKSDVSEKKFKALIDSLTNERIQVNENSINEIISRYIE